MGPLAIILGSKLDEKKSGKIYLVDPEGNTEELVHLVTPRGDVLSIKEKDIVHHENVDCGGDLKRYAVRDDAVVILELALRRIGPPWGIFPINIKDSDSTYPKTTQDDIGY